MRAASRKSRTYSITMQLIFVVFLLLLPVVFFSVFINLQYMQSGMEQVKQSRTRLLESHMSQIDRELDLAANYMNSLTFHNGTTIYLTDRSTPRFYYAANAIHQEIAKTTLYYQYIRALFLFVPASEFQYTYFLDGPSVEEQEQTREFLARELTSLAGDGWQEHEIGGDRCLILCYESNGMMSASKVFWD